MLTTIKGLKYLFLEPAYGRQYGTQEQALEDWKRGKDFVLLNGQYCSIRDREAIRNNLDDPTVLIEYKINKFVKV